MNTKKNSKEEEKEDKNTSPVTRKESRVKKVG